MQGFVRSPAWIYLAGFTGLRAGLALVLTNDVRTPDWRVIIPLIGWTTIARGLVPIYVPLYLEASGSWILERLRLLLVAAALNLAIGLVLSDFGYFG